MIRLQDIADRVGVSRTTVSNVLHGQTKRVSKETRDKIAAILEEENYKPNMGSLMLAKNESKLIGVVLWYERPQGLNLLQDPFVNSVLAGMHEEVRNTDYFLMLIGGQDLQRVINIASLWNIEGLITVGIFEENLIHLRKVLNKPIVSIDTYATQKAKVINVGVNDYDGGYQMGRFFVQRGLNKSVYITAYNKNADYYRWLGFKKAMEEADIYCGDNRNILVPSDVPTRLSFYGKILDRLLESRGMFCASDALAIEAINYFYDQGIRVPEQMSVAGFDDIVYATSIRPQLTSIHQDIEEKGALALRELIRVIGEKSTESKRIKMPVRLVVRDSVI